DITGQVINNLLVIKQIKSKDKRHRFWLCECKNCGLQVELRTVNVRRRNGVCVNCVKLGICRSPNWRGCGELSASHFCRIRNSATRNKYEFNLTIEYCWELFLKQDRKCALTGQFLYMPDKFNKGKLIASLDRIDSTKGYLIGNVQWVEVSINYLKSNWPNDKFLDTCCMIADTYRKAQ
ncbi:MAG: hypothetical protein AABY22_06420, partial [Nanoarchaeota archaeon]